MSVQQRAATVAELRARTNEITGQVKDARKRLEILATLIPEAVAGADASLVQQLRNERRNLELVTRDHEVAERVLARKLETAVQELAVEQLPEALHRAQVARNELETTAERIAGETQKYLDARRTFLETRNRAHVGDGRPSGDIQPRTPLAGAVIRMIRDSFGAT
jgi:hypothetical protein